MNMEMNPDILAELLQKFNPPKDGLDILSIISVPILSFCALIITIIFSTKQWLLMKYEYRLKLYPERFEIYKYLTELSFKLQSIDNIIGDKYKLDILRIEDKMFLFNREINNKYQEFIHWIKTNDTSNSGSEMSRYTIQYKEKLSLLINTMREYFLKLHKKWI